MKMYYLLYVLYLLITIFCFYIIFIFLVRTKIEKLWNEILWYFNKRNCLLPSIYEISKQEIVKHNEIFEELLKLKKLDFLEKNIGKDLDERLNTQTLIHNELNFIYKIFTKHPKLLKNEKFLYINDIILDNSLNISKKLELYKNIINKFNYLIHIKQLTLIWLLIPISKIENI